MGSFDDDQRKVREAQRRYIETHWGDVGSMPSRVERCADPRDPITLLGALTEITYVTSKRGDPKNTHYWHDFSFKRPPFLGFNPDGLLVILGGSYRVTRRGIVG